jgi:hypothetical protein
MIEHELIAPDLPGWRMAGTGGFRFIDNRTIESFGGPGLLWHAEPVPEDFELETEWRTTGPEDNSGILLRAPPLDGSIGPALEQAYEVQIDDRGIDPETGRAGSPMHLTGAIYKWAPVAELLSRPTGAWNHFRICVRGVAIAVELNGAPVTRFAGAARRAGHLALQCHHDGSAVQFRSFKLTTAS